MKNIPTFEEFLNESSNNMKQFAYTDGTKLDKDVVDESLNEFGPLAGSGNTDQLEKIKRDAMRKSEKKSGETVYVVGGKYGSYKISKYYEEDNTYAAFHNGIEMPVDESLNEGAMKDLHVIAQESKNYEDFKRRFLEKYGKELKGAKDLDGWLEKLYNDTK